MPNDPLYQNAYTGNVSDLWHDWLARVMSGRNPDGTSYTMPINIAADIPDFTTALSNAMNNLGTAVSGATSGLSDQIAAAQAAAQGITVAAGTLPSAVAGALTASTNSQTSTFNTIIAQNDSIILELGRVAMLLQMIIGEDVTQDDISGTLVSNDQ